MERVQLVLLLLHRHHHDRVRQDRPGDSGMRFLSCGGISLSNKQYYLPIYMKLRIATRITETTRTRYVTCPARERCLHIVFVARGPHQWHPHRNAWGLFRPKGRIHIVHVLLSICKHVNRCDTCKSRCKIFSSLSNSRVSKSARARKYC